MNSAAYLIVSPYDDSPNFARGFEVGAIWEAMERSEDFITRTVFEENVSVLAAVAHACSYVCDFTPIGKGLVTFTAHKTQPPGDRLFPESLFEAGRA